MCDVIIDVARAACLGRHAARASMSTGTVCVVLFLLSMQAVLLTTQPAFYPKESLRHASQSVRRPDEGNPVVLWFEPFIWEWPGNGANPVSAECRIKLTQQLEKTGYLCRLRK